MNDLLSRLQATLGADVYRIERELGGGGMSRVFLAEEVELGRKVVIKVLPPDMAAGVNKERFQREIKLAASLQHPHIVPLLTAGSTEDLIWYVMPYIEGESLRAKLAREGELPIAETVQILTEVMDALAYAHESEVVHRDIKPDNVMLSRGHALVTDFGVAKAVSASSGGTQSGLTSLGVALGTPSYMSPEQAAADPHVDHRADIYAVGALAYEMLTGRPPFVKQTPQQVLAAQVTEMPDSVISHRNTVPPRLADVVMRCLVKRPADRWQTASELKAHLSAAVTPASGAITPDSGGLTPPGTLPVSRVVTGQGVWSGVRALVDTPIKLAAVYIGASAVALLLVYALMIALGLPDWVFTGGVVLAAIGLPIMLVTGRTEQKKVEARATGLHVATPVGLERHLTWKKALAGGALAFTSLGMVAGSFMGMRLAGIGPAATLISSGALGVDDDLILSEFTNRTADSTLGPTVTELLRVSISQSDAVRLLDPARVSEALERMERDPASVVDEATALEIAERDGYKAILSGAIAPLGGGFVVSARLLASDGKVLTSSQVNASSADALITAVGELATDLREDIGESLRSIRRTIPLDRVTTGSMQALRLYTQAALAEIAGDDDRAVALLEEAVTIDTAFAMAYRKIGTILSNNAVRADRVIEVSTKAYELRHRLTDLERGYAIANYHSSVTGDGQAAIAAYRTILEQYPNDHRALNNSGVQYLFLGDFARAREYWAAAVSVDSTWPIGYRNVAVAEAVLDNPAGAQSVLGAMERRFPGNPRVVQTNGDIALIEERYDDARRYWRELLSSESASPEWRAEMNEKLAYTAAVRGQAREADRLARESLAARAERNAPAALLREAIEWAVVRYSNTGDRAASNRLVSEALQATPIEGLPVASRPYEELIDYHVTTGDIQQAERWLRAMELSGQIDLGRDFQAAGDRSRGAVAVAAGNAQRGLVDYRRGAEASVCPDCGWAGLAAVFDAIGEPDSALHYWKKFADFRPFRPHVIGRYRAVSLRRVGELYEQRGERENALAYYNRFVELWSDPDPELQPIVQDVRQSMARLVGESD
jgi:tetratricopeptide (TPR) repeat protein